MTCEHDNERYFGQNTRMAIGPEDRLEVMSAEKWCQDCGALHVSPLDENELKGGWFEPDRNDEFPVFSAWEMHLKAAVGLANSAGQSPTETISALVMILSESVEPAALVRALGLACSANGDLYLLCDEFMRNTLAKREEPCPK